MVTLGLDLSHYQGTAIDFAQCRREGVEFVFLKSTEGASFVDSAFATNLGKARGAGLLVAAYHYVRGNATAAAQVANVARVVPRDVAVIPDVEANSGGVALVRDFVAGLRAAGYHVPLTYLPRWYWQQIGSPSLVGLPPLWSSRYLDNNRGPLIDKLADVPASYWSGYGGLGVTVLQYTSSARIAGHEPLDGNAFIGTREQIAALLGGEECDMSIWTEDAKAGYDQIYRVLVDGTGYVGSALEQNLGYVVGEQRRMHAETLEAIASGDLDPESLTQRMETAARQGAAEATERAITTTVLPALRGVLTDVLGDDNDEQAEAIVAALARHLTTKEN